MEKRRIVDINELTPVDMYYGSGGFDKIYLKREDLYLPYNDIPWLGGGKIKQSISLFETIKDELNKFDGIATYIQVDSPQGIIISKVAKEFGFKVAITIGVDDINKAVKLHKSLQLCKQAGAELIPIGSCRSNAIALKNTIPIAEKMNYYIIHFGINVDSAPYALTEKISHQVQNIPDELDALIIPIGSGLQTAAILAGIKKYNKRVDKIIGIQITGIDRSKTINKILEKLDASDVKYQQILDKTYPYSKHVEVAIRDKDDFKKSIELNKVYESKAWEYLVKHKKELGLNKNSEILYWIVGNNNANYGD